MPHYCDKNEDSILNKEYPVLDHGFVRLIDYMGSDERITEAARVSYGGKKKTAKEDKLLIDYLMAHGHTSPFEHVVFEFHCKMPIFVARQWLRHRTARINEVSGRYTVMKEEFYLPEESRIQLQSKTNRQGSSDEVIDNETKKKVIQTMVSNQQSSSLGYDNLLEMGISKEIARINLPLSLYTEFYWQMDLHNLFHFIKLRMDSHAQWEIQEYARVLAKIVKNITPMAWDAFERHVLNSITFSSDEMNVIRENIKTIDRENLGLEGQSKIDFLKKIEG